ncbi:MULTISPECIES: sensor domain-containing diguanylate cyclase [Mycobacterium]|uniref:Cyclic diguanylate phosphodiesterase domain-containing protein n=1 Tax=Mycobacterium indicus pranii (strain DSM 45239 / MTCC 9506) TaxID=1232724 RepID=J9WMY9_MYCIP|nr:MULTISPECIES: sensor domain-containing diguanylate cyclase [Mycobacterium]AFS16007.1 Cyclic diguanylate phosphodiesterase domain-containing protein [Mycobacterium intracellulare subsp. intracellulare MTCC 9506]WSE52592.1 sensor domain-containing diguanylate cyclase [Mycobacterium sp. 2-64]
MLRAERREREGQPMDRPGPDARLESAMNTSGRAAALLVLVVAALTWVGWTAGIERLTRIYPTWPQMMPWTALWLAALGAAILLQWGSPSRERRWAGRCLAAAAAAFAVLVLAEYASLGSFTVDRIWFGEAVGMREWSWPGRPSVQTALSALPLATAVALIRVDRCTRAVWPLCLAASAAIPFVTAGAYLFDALALVGVSPSKGQAFLTAAVLLLLVAATSLARVDRFPLAWLLARPDRSSLVRLLAILAGFPLVVAVVRPIFLELGPDANAQWTFSILLGTAVVGAVTFYFSQREQHLLIAKELASKQRAEAETRYRILADNAVDIIVHFRGGGVAWISPSVEPALGGPLSRWTGTDFARRIHPEDRDKLQTALRRIAGGEQVLQRFRVCSLDGEYHWVDGHGKPYTDAQGNTDGLIAALRVVDDQVEAEQQLERLARFDTLTGLVNRAEAMARLDAALRQPRPPETHVGVLFCDVDHFKAINDRWGHGTGDVVLATVAARIRASVRREDTVGRTGGDEMLILLPGVRSADELAQIAEKIRRRVAEPIHVSGNTIGATLSIGATLALPAESVDAVTARADEAMYRAKSGDRNAVVAT